MDGDEIGRRIHPAVIDFHEAGIEVIAVCHDGVLTLKDLRWLRIDALQVLTRAQDLLNTLEAYSDDH